MTLPNETPKGEYVMTVFHFSLRTEWLGVAPTKEFRMNFVVGDEKSEEMVEVQGTVVAQG